MIKKIRGGLGKQYGKQPEIVQKSDHIHDQALVDILSEIEA